jgi:hypothetical protein
VPDPRVSVAIMAHPKRAAFVPELEHALDRPATVVWDDGANSRWGTGRRALLAYDPDATHHLVIQDDAVIPRDLAAGVEAALPHVPGDVPVCLYVGKVRPYREMVTEYVARAASASWLVMDRLNWGVAIVLPTNVIDEVVAYCDTLSIPNYDSRVSAWFEANGTPVWYPWPSLVDHRESPSLVPGRGASGRVAHRFIGAGTSALAIDYTGQALHLPDANDYRPGGPVTMLFYCEPYDNLTVPTAGIRFKNHYFKATTAGQISYLQQPRMARYRGVRPATEEEEIAWNEANGVPMLRVAEPGPVQAPAGTVEVQEPALVAQPEGTVPIEETPAEGDVAEVPEGSAADVLAWVGDDTDRARAAHDAETAGKQRKTLLADLAKIIDGE